MIMNLDLNNENFLLLYFRLTIRHWKIESNNTADEDHGGRKFSGVLLIVDEVL